MPRLAEALSAARAEGRASLVPYVMVDKARTRRLGAVVDSARACGATALELGFPFSDPIADGPILQATADRALADGTGWGDLVESLEIASAILPTAVMSYANPFWRHGLDRALGDIQRAGASGLIVPDLSLEEAPGWIEAAGRSSIDLVLLAAPGVSEERTGRLARATRGFLYLVARYGTTGTARSAERIDLAPIVRTAHRAAPATPVLVGFGIRDRATAAQALAYGADGVIVASALEQQFVRSFGPGTVRRILVPIARMLRSRGT
ncbi:MAG: tryptophan synthase subunit alpha [Thermoplasmata archaeon]